MQIIVRKWFAEHTFSHLQREFREAEEFGEIDYFLLAIAKRPMDERISHRTNIARKQLQ